MDNIGHETWWNYFVENCNDVCPKCGKRITRHEDGIECSRTKRGTSVFFHRKCERKEQNA